MFCAADFKSRCDPIITNLEPDGIVRANVLVSVAIKSNSKYPLLFLPDFVEDWINGTYSRKMMDKYHIHTYTDFNALTSLTLRFGKQRAKGRNEDSREKNLAVQSWRRRYDLLVSQFRLFRPQLVDMHNCSVLRTLVAHAVLRQQYISYNNIEKSVLESYNALKESIHVPQDATFDGYIENELARKIDLVVSRMAQESLLTNIEGDVSIPAKYAHMRAWIQDILEGNKGSMQYQSLVTKILNKFPLLRMLPSRNEIDSILDSLEHDGSIICKRAFWKFAPYSNHIFSSRSYKARIEEMKAQAVLLGHTKFFGRRITPDHFLSELQALEPGDLGDQDDQVTRIAGLVLSDAVLLQSPAEYVPGFDFVMDFTNYRHEHEDMMRRLNCEVRAKLFHCKVMIKDEITVREIDELRRVVPDGEQGIVFTCSPVHPDVRQQTLDDRTIQIIDEDGIRTWCSNTSTIPCRLNSVARVMYGDSRGKAVVVRSVNYESGMAIVEAAPDCNEMMLPIGCLEEIGPYTSILTDMESRDSARRQNEVGHTEDDFAVASEEYFEFLCDLASLAQSTFEDGFVLHAHAVHETRRDLMKSVRPELFGGLHPDVDISTKSQHNRYVEFKNGTYSTVNIQPTAKNDPFACECSHRLNETYRFTLCSHLVAAIIRLGFEEHNDSEFAKYQIRAFREGLRAFRVKNVTRVVLALRYVIEDDSRHLLKKYIWSHMSSEDNNRWENQDTTNSVGSDDAEKHIRDLLEDNSEMLGLLETLKTDMVRLNENELRRVVNTLYDH